MNVKGLRNDNKISANKICTFKICIVMAFPTKRRAYWDNFHLCPQAETLQYAKFIFIVVSPSLRLVFSLSMP